MSRKAQLIITFDSTDLRDEFKGWLSDGGGEYNFMEGLEMREGAKVDFDYVGNTVIVTTRKTDD